MLDLEAENRPMSLDEVRQMQGMKTGALIQFVAVAGGIHGGANEGLEAELRLCTRSRPGVPDCRRSPRLCR